MSIVAITGANGFIGSLLVDYLVHAGHEVRAMVRPGSRISLIPHALQDRVVRVDYADTAAWEGVEIIVHLAAITKGRTWEDYRRQNVELTRTVVEAANRTPSVRRLVLLSSQSAAGEQTGARPVTESDPCHPVSDYGRSKLAAEQVVRDHCTKDWSIIRSVSVYGPGEKDFLSYFRMARLGFVIIAGGNDRVLNLIDGRDLVRFIGLVMNHPAAVRETFFASDGEVYRMDNFIHEIARAMNRPVRILRIPFGLMYPITAIVEGWARLTGRKTPVLNPSRLPDFAAKRWLCNSEKAVALLGFQPLYPLPRGVGETYRWYREHGWL